MATSVFQTHEEVYQELKAVFKAKHGKEPKVADIIAGLELRIKNSDIDPVFNGISSKMAQELKRKFFEEKVEIVAKTPEVKAPEVKAPEAEVKAPAK